MRMFIAASIIALAVIISSATAIGFINDGSQDARVNRTIALYDKSTGNLIRLGNTDTAIFKGEFEIEGDSFRCDKFTMDGVNWDNVGMITGNIPDFTVNILQLKKYTILNKTEEKYENRYYEIKDVIDAFNTKLPPQYRLTKEDFIDNLRRKGK